eukprot:3107737-Amphidinium_carterae.1
MHTRASAAGVGRGCTRALMANMRSTDLSRVDKCKQVSIDKPTENGDESIDKDGRGLAQSLEDVSKRVRSCKFHNSIDSPCVTLASSTVPAIIQKFKTHSNRKSATKSMMKLEVGNCTKKVEVGNKS